MSKEDRLKVAEDLEKLFYTHCGGLALINHLMNCRKCAESFRDILSHLLERYEHDFNHAYFDWGISPVELEEVK